MPAQQAIAQEGLLWFPSEVRDAPKMCRSRACVPNLRYCARMSVIWSIGEASVFTGG